MSDIQLNGDVLCAITSIIEFNTDNAVVVIRAYNHIIEALGKRSFDPNQVIETDIVFAAITLAKTSLRYKPSTGFESVIGKIVP